MIDFHAHYGINYSWNILRQDLDLLRKTSKDLSITKAVLMSQPFPYHNSFFTSLPPEEFSVNYSSINNEIGLLCNADDLFLFFAHLNPDLPKQSEEIDKCIKNYDCSGIKIHSATCCSGPERLALDGILDSAKEYDLPIILHPYDNDEALLDIARDYSDVNFVIAHLGFCSYEIVNACKELHNLFLDTSGVSSITWKIICREEKLVSNKNILPEIFNYWYYVDAERRKPDISSEEKLNNSFPKTPALIVRRIVDLVGDDKVLWGSDSPWSSQEKEFEALNLLTDYEKEKVSRINAEKILKGI